jgi:hypothetical protein
MVKIRLKSLMVENLDFLLTGELFHQLIEKLYRPQ